VRHPHQPCLPAMGALLGHEHGEEVAIAPLLGLGLLRELAHSRRALARFRRLRMRRAHRRQQQARALHVRRSFRNRYGSPAPQRLRIFVRSHPRARPLPCYLRPARFNRCFNLNSGRETAHDLSTVRDRDRHRRDRPCRRAIRAAAFSIQNGREHSFSGPDGRSCADLQSRAPRCACDEHLAHGSSTRSRDTSRYSRKLVSSRLSASCLVSRGSWMWARAIAAARPSHAAFRCSGRR
jgi:hypothetical protein